MSRFNPTDYARKTLPVSPVAARRQQREPIWNPPGSVDLYSVSRQTLGEGWVYLLRELDVYLQQHGTVALESLVAERNGRGAKPWAALVARAEEARSYRAVLVRR